MVARCIVATVVLVLSVPGCQKPQKVTVAASNSCIAQDSVPESCENMLPRDWEENPAAVFAMLTDTSAQRKIRFAPAISEKDRRTDIDCRAKNGGGEKKIGLIYQTPAAMKNFPVTGTNGRAFLVAQFTIGKNEKCREARYGILEPKDGAAGPIVYFITVKTTNVDPVRSGFDRRIGDWTAWRVYEKSAEGFVREELRTGAYIQCGHEHDMTTYGDAAFTSCDASRPPTGKAVMGALDRYFTIRSAHAATARAASTMLDVLSDEVDPAWGRCGALGCCASY